MRIPTLAKRTLALALTAACAAPVLGMATPVTGVPLALVAFGDKTASQDDRSADFAASAPILSPTDIATLGKDVTDHMLAMVKASALPLSADEAVTLSRLLEAGTPVFIDMDTNDPDARDRVSAFFGVAPTEGNVILRKERASTTVFASSQDGPGDTGDLLSALASAPRSTVITDNSDRAASISSEESASLPTRRFDINFVSAEGEIFSTANVDVTRSRTTATDNKMVTITSKTVIKTAKNGVGRVSAGPIANLPIEYRAGHSVLTQDGDVTYLDSYPDTDARTDFTKSDSKTRGYTIGGSVGAELSATGKPDQVLAAKVPLNLSYTYKNEWQSNLSTTFKDYSLLAIPDTRNSVDWIAVLAPSLKDTLITSWNSKKVDLTEDRMTAMMRTATLETMSHWKIPGDYEKTLAVSIGGGYTLQSDSWWTGANGGYNYERKPVEKIAGKIFNFDMSDPFLTAEITVLIRSATGSGECLRDRDGVVDLAACLSTDRSQMWGLDAASRYVNRKSGQCLSVEPATRAVVTVGCEGITFEKQWQWRADRLHSLVDHGRYRLYVEGGAVHYAAAEGRFEDFPVNPYAAPLNPWTGYPAAPRVGIDFIPVPGSVKLEPVPAGYAAFPRVSDEQRWHLEVLRTRL